MPTVRKRRVWVLGAILVAGGCLFLGLLAFVGMGSYEWGRNSAYADAMIASRCDTIGEYIIIWESCGDNPERLKDWLTEATKMGLSDMRSMRTFQGEDGKRVIDLHIRLAERLLGMLEEE